MLSLLPQLTPHLGLRTFRELKNDRRGVTALEYGLLAGLIAVALIGVLTTFGNDVKALFTNISGDVAGVTPATGGTGVAAGS